ncbi:FMN reductase [Actinokineospora sp. HUAS TT18]|uniref:FMN reductase n=1 Tax=Actinokineospora sp. HUAS TT18 TaxID=3447451 RepID=UPI003F5270AE
MTKLAVISAGLSEPSSSRLLADRLAAAVTATEVTTVHLRDHAHAITDQLLTGFPPASLRPVIDAMVDADALIAVTPVFTASYSGLFKSFFDGLEPDTLSGKPVLIGATGGTARHSLVLEHALRPMFAYLRAIVVPTAVYAASEDWGDTTSGLADRITLAGGELTALLAGTRPAPKRDPYAEPVPFEELLGDIAKAG